MLMAPLSRPTSVSSTENVQTVMWAKSRESRGEARRTHMRASLVLQVEDEEDASSIVNHMLK